MRTRGRGGFIIMSSLAGNQGSAGLSVYAATKAFGAVLAEGLWQELRGTGVDVLACVPGAVASPNLVKAAQRKAPGTLPPERVAAAALAALGRRPRTVPGVFMKASSPVMTRLLPRRVAIAIMGRATGEVLGKPG
jgi:short-subunit dehydrogenase